MALPALSGLAAAGFKPVLVGRPWAADLLAGHGWPVYGLPRTRSAAVAVLRQIGCREGLLLTNSFSSAMQCRWAGVKALGYRGDARSWLLARAVQRPVGVHEVAVFWHLAATLQAWRAPERAPWASAPPAALGLHLSPAHEAAAQAALQAVLPHPRAPYAVLAPLAAGTVRGQSKCWPGYAALVRFMQDQGVVPVVCPGPDERAAAQAAAPGAVCLPGLGLGAYAAVCRGAQLTVANDSGPMHLAAAVGAPVLGLFGPSDPARTHPWAPGAQWLGGHGLWPGQAEVERAVGALLHAAQART